MSIEAMKQGLEALDHVNKSDDDCDFMNMETAAMVGDAMDTLSKAIAEAEKQKPLASAAYDRIDRFIRNNLDDIDYAAYSEALDRIYTHPQPKREPLTEEQARALFGEFYNMAVIRNVEAAHGIKEKNT